MAASVFDFQVRDYSTIPSIIKALIEINRFCSNITTH